MGINKKITFNKHFARKYIRAYTYQETGVVVARGPVENGFDNL